MSAGIRALLARCKPRNLGTLTSTISSGASPVGLTLHNQLAPSTRRTRRVGASDLVEKVALVVAYIAFTVTAGTMDGTVAGYRLKEMPQFKIKPNGYDKYAFDCSGLANWELNKRTLGKIGNPTVVNAGVASGAGATTATEKHHLFFAHADGARPEDTCPDALNFGKGEFSLGCNAVDADGLTAQSITSIRLVAWTFWGHPGLPVARSVVEDDITSQLNAGRIAYRGRRVLHSLLRSNKGQQDGSAVSHLQAYFDGTVAFNKLVMNGERVIDGALISDLVDAENLHMNDAAAEATAATPDCVPIVGAHGQELISKHLEGDDDAAFEFSANPRHSGGSTQTVKHLSDQTYPFEKGTDTFAEYCRGAGYPEGADYFRYAASKNPDVDPAKADALPWRMKGV